MNKKIINWILVFLWAGVIFFFSHQPDLKSGFPNQWDFVLRKLAHISEYAVLTFLLFRALNGNQLNKKKILFFSFLISFLYAISDEYHQTFILGRNGAVRDVLIDSIGMILVVWYKISK